MGEGAAVAVIWSHYQLSLLFVRGCLLINRRCSAPRKALRCCLLSESNLHTAFKSRLQYRRSRSIILMPQLNTAAVDLILIL
jgi:hypothetical protein